MADWVGGVFAGVLVTLVTQYLGNWFQRKRFFHEHLMERYADLVATASAELDRARCVEATYAVCDVDQEATKSWLAERYKERDDLRRQLSRIVFQVRLLEKDHAMNERIQKLCKHQPFLAGGRFGQGNFDDRFDRYQKDVAEYANLVDSFIEVVLQRHVG